MLTAVQLKHPMFSCTTCAILVSDSVPSVCAVCRNTYCAPCLQKHHDLQLQGNWDACGEDPFPQASLSASDDSSSSQGLASESALFYPLRVYRDMYMAHEIGPGKSWQGMLGSDIDRRLMRRDLQSAPARQVKIQCRMTDIVGLPQAVLDHSGTDWLASPPENDPPTLWALSDSAFFKSVTSSLFGMVPGSQCAHANPELLQKVHPHIAVKVAGSFLRTYALSGSGGGKEARIERVLYAPSSGMEVFSETWEVKVHRSDYTLGQSDGRILHTAKGLEVHLRVLPNSTAWMCISAIIDPGQIARLLCDQVSIHYPYSPNTDHIDWELVDAAGQESWGAWLFRHSIARWLPSPRAPQRGRRQLRQAQLGSSRFNPYASRPSSSS